MTLNTAQRLYSIQVVGARVFDKKDTKEPRLHILQHRAMRARPNGAGYPDY